jgi:hypothetical protein
MFSETSTYFFPEKTRFASFIFWLFLFDKKLVKYLIELIKFPSAQSKKGLFANSKYFRHRKYILDLRTSWFLKNKNRLNLRGFAPLTLLLAAWLSGTASASGTVDHRFESRQVERFLELICM